MKKLIASVIAFALTVSTVWAGDNVGQARSTQLSTASTDSIVGLLDAGEATCSRLDAVYQFDCYRQAYRAAGAEAKKNRSYADAAKALKDVEKVLNDTVRKNRDRSKPTIRVGGQTYKAIKPEAVAAGAAAFQSARNQSATLLLRSGGDAKVHYTRIAQAMDSDKLLIRS